MSLALKLVGVAAALFVSQVAYLVIVRLFLSPLCVFPGPKWAALTEWWEVLHTIKCSSVLFDDS